MKEDKHFNEEFERLMYRAYIRDGKTVHGNEALLLACLLHAKGKRNSDDMKAVQEIMNDKNLNRG